MEYQLRHYKGGCAARATIRNRYKELTQKFNFEIELLKVEFALAMENEDTIMFNNNTG